MDTSQTIQVYNKFDIITARSRVRDAAAAGGFDTMDQVRISLAMWLSAHSLALGGLHQGLVTVCTLQDGIRAGVRVTCEKSSAAKMDLLPETYSDFRWMVDELKVEALPPTGVQVTLVKWLALSVRNVSPLRGRISRDLPGPEQDGSLRA